MYSDDDENNGKTESESWSVKRNQCIADDLSGRIF